MNTERYGWDQLPDAITQLRQTVFTQEQQVPPELEWDETDRIATHYLVRDDSGTPLATARLYPEEDGAGGIGRMAVSREQRTLGVGTVLLREMMHDAFSEYDYLVLSAQEGAVDFYRRLGFYVVSDTYMDAGIPHRAMRCTAPGLLLDQEPETRCPFLLASDTTSWQIKGETDQLQLVRALADQATRRFWLYDTTLSHGLYDDHFLTEALSRLARRSRHSDIRFLIHDDYPLVKRRHRLVQLMRRLPSRISLGLVNTTYPHGDRPCVIADDSGVLIRHDFDHIEGFANFSAPRRVRPFGEDFARAWDYSRESIELRQLPF
ncbi:putative GNAT family N-acyltransferase [Halospina denitrificans]|uniref:Putative GNAT family N-acyltransferase n=1 Tax=Halospina denitrificans TaxID=332522 RepID=A0A4R7JQ90_9GAMM|nr:GNAT family N-acetyltransferase [Halospina denitrificans]TDT39417.1 putative GNAT family N-acyltransferase [Halospina denitrificans]